jgi:RimJ/RimL family protein N-acetyltransferase
VIETKRLLLRPMEMYDLDELLAVHAEPAVVRFMGSLDRQRAVERLRLDQRDWHDRGHGLMAVIERESGRFVGRTGLRYWSGFDETEVGWVFHPEVWGRGFATEAARACVRWGFRSLEVPYLTAMIRPANRRSIRVARRLKMKPARNDTLLDIPVVVYRLDRPTTAS